MTATTWVCPDRLFDGKALRKGLALGLAQGRTTRILPASQRPAGAACVSVPGVLVPGYVDLQVNGGGDVLFNADPTPRGIAAIAAAHRRFGTVAILVTLITDAPEVQARAVEAALAARGTPGFAGIHIEGPHLSLPRRGTHRAGYIRPLDDATIAQVARLRAAGVAVMLTLAPESVAPGQVAHLVGLGAVVSIGHSDASADAVRALLAEGAQCFTHLFNAMSPMLNRAPGVTGACINSTAYAGIICDGIHVADEMVGLAIRARPVPDRMFLVSDAMSTVGGSGRFTLYGEEIRLVEGRLVNAEGSLAGAHVTMAESLARLIGTLGLNPAQALRMTSTVPATLMNQPALSGVAGREAADLLVLDRHWAVRGTLAEFAQEAAA